MQGALLSVSARCAQSYWHSASDCIGLDWVGRYAGRRQWREWALPEKGVVIGWCNRNEAIASVRQDRPDEFRSKGSQVRSGEKHSGVRLRLEMGFTC